MSKVRAALMSAFHITSPLNGKVLRPPTETTEHHLYANFLMQVGRVTDAIREFERSTDVLPLNPGTQFAFARASLVDGNPNAAEQRFDTVKELVDAPGMDGVRRDPTFPALLQRLGLIHYWKETHTKPDVCTRNGPPPFCAMI